MMKHIQITKADINGTEINSVNSRDLHKSLEVKTDYSTWAKRLLEKYSFVEDEDYLTVSKKEGRQTLIDYIVTLDVAKELCMVTNTKIGREQRKYFISIEKQHNGGLVKSLSDQQQKTQALFQTQEVMGEVITSHDKRIDSIEKTQEDLKQRFTIEHWQQKALTDAKNKTVYSLAKDDEKLIRKLHMKVWSLFKKRFSIPRYNELPAYKYEDGLEFIGNLTLSDMVA